MSRAPSTPPELAGFEYVKLLGSGGFADVFLYQQQLPRRRVAVKVLLSDKMTADAVASFTAEANTMAQLSTHPYIVSIYQADIAGDGRPYLVMEYCPKANLQTRYRKGPFSVAEALRVGIQVAGAVETAHRAGILHRDIKPGNILGTEYNRPALTDFGIAQAAGGDSEPVGMSIPWSPPESFVEGHPSSAATDIFALGATVYTLVAGRSPFEIPGGKNSSAELISRIQSSPVTSVGRADVPASLHHVFEQAMAKSPEERFGSALEFGRALQKVEIELNLSATSIDILDDSVDDEGEADEDDGKTRVRAVVSIDPTGPAPDAKAQPSFSTTNATVLRGQTASPASSDTVMRGSESAPDATVARGPSYATGGAPEPAPTSDTRAKIRPSKQQKTVSTAGERKTGGLWKILAPVAAIAVVGGGIAAASLVGGGSEPSPSQTPTPTVVTIPPGSVPKVESVEGTVMGEEIVFTWTNPDPRAGDVYQWGIFENETVYFRELTEETEVSVEYDGENPVCIEVTLVRATWEQSGVVEACAP